MPCLGCCSTAFLAPYTAKLGLFEVSLLAFASAGSVQLWNRGSWHDLLPQAGIVVRHLYYGGSAGVGSAADAADNAAI